MTPGQLVRDARRSAGLSQQALATRLGAAPSRVVKLVDELEEHGLVERRRSTTDRRQQELHLAACASDHLTAVRSVVADHDADITGALTDTERSTLLGLLVKVADAQGLGGEGHPGDK